MKAGRPKVISQSARERMALPSCEKCRYLTTKAKQPACSLGNGLALCDSFKDASKATPRPEGGITRIYHYPR